MSDQDEHNTQAPRELMELVELEREDFRRRPPEWDRVAAGEMSAEDAAARIRERRAQSEEEIAEAAALFAPPSSDYEPALVDRLAGPTLHTATPDNVVQVPAHRWRVPLVAGVAAIAAAVLLWWAGGMRSQPEPTHETGIAVPSHELWIEGTAQVRGDEAEEAPRVAAGSTMTFFLRPRQAYAAEPVVWACVELDGERRSLPVQTKRQGEVVQASAELPAHMQHGTWKLLAFVSHAEAPAALCDATPGETLRVQEHIFVVGE